ncbi:hypothetical protein Trco_002545 [Trichoderma cornu-damae]|uniref:Uncharacterized protein n=1 Tax=Trichoderma cornu-damae TaxID=654480 RepID=A0A9P8TXX5_9HYPO|nr:hypothetical protein Trco_002545 [Trichoderma cornu-damae]
MCDQPHGGQRASFEQIGSGVFHARPCPFHSAGGKSRCACGAAVVQAIASPTDSRSQSVVFLASHWAAPCPTVEAAAGLQVASLVLAGQAMHNNLNIRAAKGEGRSPADKLRAQAPVTKMARTAEGEMLQEEGRPRI